MLCCKRIQEECINQSLEEHRLESVSITSSRSKHTMSEIMAKEIVEGRGGRTGNIIMAKTKVYFRVASRKQMDLPSLHG